MIVILTGLWLGVLTAISPCPLATNIAALTYLLSKMAKRTLFFFSGILYSLGRSFTYTIIGFFISQGFMEIPKLSFFLQNYFNKFLGPLLIIIGMFLLELLNINFSFSLKENTAKRFGEWGVIGSLILGILFAFAFCPISAVLFFGSLIPLAIAHKLPLFLPFLFGIGTSLPVLLFAILIGIGFQYFDKIYKNIFKIEFYAKKLTGIVFILIGIYYCLGYIYKISIFLK